MLLHARGSYTAPYHVPASAPASDTVSALFLLVLLLLIHAYAPLDAAASVAAPVHSFFNPLPPDPTLSPAHAYTPFLFTAATAPAHIPAPDPLLLSASHFTPSAANAHATLPFTHACVSHPARAH
jgi:hypothetical protein